MYKETFYVVAEMLMEKQISDFESLCFSIFEEALESVAGNEDLFKDKKKLMLEIHYNSHDTLVAKFPDVLFLPTVYFEQLKEFEIAYAKEIGEVLKKGTEKRSNQLVTALMNRK